MCFLPLQQDFYSKSGHASPQNSSQIYAYAKRHTNICDWRHYHAAFVGRTGEGAIYILDNSICFVNYRLSLRDGTGKGLGQQSVTW